MKPDLTKAAAPAQESQPEDLFASLLAKPTRLGEERPPEKTLAIKPVESRKWFDGDWDLPEPNIRDQNIWSRREMEQEAIKAEMLRYMEMREPGLRSRTICLTCWGRDPQCPARRYPRY
jgi:hypothetical protein